MTASVLLLAVALAPCAGILLIAVTQHWRAVSAWINLVASLVVLAAALPLPVLARHGEIILVRGYVLLDGLGAWTMLCTSLVYALSSLYAVGYMRLLDEPERLPAFYMLFAGFALTTLLAPVMNNAGIYWIAIELTTLVSTFLVAFERTAESIEAAWKYIIVVSGGISLALLGTVLFYWNASFTLGQTYRMDWSALRGAGPHMHHDLLALSFLLVLVGYGTKVGLAPMHTWLPDAHSEGPAPVSALLSGALLNAAMVGIVRYLSIADAAGLGGLAHAALVVFGAASLLLAAFAIVRQDKIKRLMAYSSVEHMGVIALGFGFGGPIAVAGALYHMLNHSLNKSLMFFGAGAMMEAYHSSAIAGIADAGRRFPVMAALWLAGAVAITGAPPFGLFASELAILRGGFASASAWAAVLMVLLLIVIFVGFLNHFRMMYYEPAGVAVRAPRSIGWICVLPMWLALAPILVLGVWWPEWFWTYFRQVAAALGQGSAR